MGNVASKVQYLFSINERVYHIYNLIFLSSLFFGNIFVYFQFLNKTHIDEDTRRILFIVLSVVSLIGLIFFSLLRQVSPKDDDELGNNTPALRDTTALGEFKNAGKLFITPNMMLLSITFFYTGLELSFFSGVYSPSIGFTSRFGEIAKQLVGLSGICIGFGEVFGGVLFGLMGSKFSRLGRDPIVIAGFVVHIISFFLIFINLPDASPFTDTTNVSYLDPPIAWIALLCSFLLGLGDSCFNTQIYSMLGGSFSKNSAAAFALFKFTQSLAAASSFIYSSHFGLRVQLGILTVFAVIGTICFVTVERRLRKIQSVEDTKSKTETFLDAEDK